MWIRLANSRQIQIDALTKQLTEANDLIDLLQNDIDSLKKENAELRRSILPDQQQHGRILRGGSREIKIVNVNLPCAMDNIDWWSGEFKATDALFFIPANDITNLNLNLPM